MSLTLLLVIMTAVLSYQAFGNSTMRNRMIFHPVSVANGEQYRLITHGFVHADWQHLLINIFVLYQFGHIAEQLFRVIFGVALGAGMFVLFYLSAIVISAIPSYFKHKDNNYYAALGASGATSALVFTYIFLDPWHWFLFPPLPAILFGIGYLWYSSYMSKRGIDNIGHDAHFWGAMYGIVFIVISAMVYRPALLTRFLELLLSGPRGF